MRNGLTTVWFCDIMNKKMMQPTMGFALCFKFFEKMLQF